MPSRDDHPLRLALQRTIRGLFCLAGLICLFVLQNPTGADQSAKTGTDGSVLFCATATEILEAEDFGATLEDSVEFARQDLPEFDGSINPTAAAKLPSRTATSSRPDRSPPLMV